jgi:2,3-bisphosphoglycerate-independent phosphoglycerate mutase
LVYVGASDQVFLGQGSLCDIAPTLLHLMSMPIPDEMTGKVLMGMALSQASA